MKKNKMTYAQVADKLTKKIGELEEKAKSSDRFARETAKTMLPRYQEKLDALYNAQEQSKQADMQKDIQSFQMKWGGDLTKYNLGGDIAAGAVGVLGGALGTIPIVGDMAQQGLYGLHGRLDKDLTDQEKSIRGYGAAAGGVAAGALSGNPMAAMGALGDAKEGYYYGTQPSQVNTHRDAYLKYAYGGRLPKMQLGGPPYPQIMEGESHNDYLARGEAEGFYPNELTSHYNLVMSDPNNNISTKQSTSVINPTTVAFNEQPAVEKSGEFVSPTYPTYEPYASNDGAGNNPSSGNNPMGWQDLLYKGAAYAPTIYNTIQGLRKPQVLDHEEFQNPYESKALGLMANRRYNIDPQLQANRSTFNNMRGNLKNYAGGNASTYLSNMGQLQMNMDRMNEQAYATKQNMDNQYKAEEADMLGNLGANRAQTKFTIQDVNDRNAAIRAAHLGKATEGLSKIAQNERYMKNLGNADLQRILAMQSIPWQMMPQFDGNQFTGFQYYKDINEE